jgi:hypothetical protein
VAARVPAFPRIFRVHVMLVDERNYPLATAKIPEFVVADLAELITGAQELNPSVTPESVIRAVWRHGSRRVWSNLRRRVPISSKDLPEPRPLARMQPPGDPAPAEGAVAGTGLPESIEVQARAD